ncbi:MAG: VWA domain-containing protein [Actinomycetota bacterium]|nr:VWA domain-containing protein [Actinomycetota bacterium]
MIRTRLVFVALVAALALPSLATGGVRLRGVDPSAFPTIRAAVVTSLPAKWAPTLTENGRPVAGLETANLGRAKSVVLAIDTSRSMAGRALADAAQAARRFVTSKPGRDRVALVTFGARAVQLSRFSTATIDADNALRTIALDPHQGTALYDAVALSARALQSESGGGRVIVVLTDGKDVGSKTSESQAVTAVRSAGAIVYSVAVGSKAATDVLQNLAGKTGGTFHGAGASSTLNGVYGSIARELRRTWRVEYVTAARPGDKLHLATNVRGLGRDDANSRVPASFGAGPASDGTPSKLLPAPVYGKFGDLLFTLLAALLVLGGGMFVMTAAKGSWLKKRLAPHVEPTRRLAKERGPRFAFMAGLYAATERAFSHRQVWHRLRLMLDRADVPLRTVEFAWLVAACSFGFGLFMAMIGQRTLVILVGFAVGGLVPYCWVALKAKNRMRAFEDQLPDLLITMAASLKAGHSFKQGIQSVVDEGHEPAAKELKRVLTDTRLGRPMEEALFETAERIGSKNFSFVITAVNIQRQVGGSLAGLFDMVADTVRQRQQFARKIRSLTAMGRASAYVLVGLPFFVALAITVLNPNYMDPLYHTSTGHTLIFVGLGMMAFGSLILRKIVSFRG